MKSSSAKYIFMLRLTAVLEVSTGEKEAEALQRPSLYSHSAINQA